MIANTLPVMMLLGIEGPLHAYSRELLGSILTLDQNAKLVPGGRAESGAPGVQA